MVALLALSICGPSPPVKIAEISEHFLDSNVNLLIHKVLLLSYIYNP